MECYPGGPSRSSASGEVVSETLLAAAQLQVGRHERSSPAPLADLVRDGGRAASSVGAADEGGLAGRNITATNVMASADASAIARLAELAVGGEIKPAIDSVLTLDETAPRSSSSRPASAARSSSPSPRNPGHCDPAPSSAPLG
jgi:hypothetical protein